MVKTPKYFLIRCKKCGNSMKYMTYGEVSEIGRKSKRCVYCGFTNKVKDCIVG